MKHKILISISVLLILLICFSSVSVFASNVNKVTFDKISPDLLSKLAEMDDEDTVEILVWLNNSTDELLENEYKSELQKYINRGVITTDLITATEMFDDSSISTEESLSVESTQQLLSIRRSAYSNVIVRNNLAWHKEVKTHLDVNSKTIYVSDYAPLVIMEVNKNDVLELASYEEVDSIYFYSNEIVGEYSSTNASVETTRTSSNYGVWQEITQIDLLHNMGYLGGGIRIGIYEQGSPDLEHSSGVFDNILTDNPYDDTPNDHATYVASILVGETNDYLSVAPSAVLVYAGYMNGMITDIDDLVDCGINVLNISFFELHQYNTYSYYSRYFDYIICKHKIAVCVAASNTSNTPNGLPDISMAYNVITVGNIDDINTTTQVDDVLASTSWYIDSNIKAYKPDLCAPGARVATPTSPKKTTQGNGGTSAATPVVAGICALLMSADSRLISRPVLAKSILMCSANRIPNMDSNYSTGNSINLAVSRSYGAGMVSAMSALTLMNSSRWRYIESSADLASDSYSINITVTQNDINANKKIAVCLTWEQSVDDDMSANNVTSYRLFLNDPNNIRVAHSNYQYDNKQFVYFAPRVVGTYKIVVEKYAVTNVKTPIAFCYVKS